MQVRRGKYPGKQEKIFPPKHPYLPKGCGDCEYKLYYNSNNPNCVACKEITKCLNHYHGSDAIKERRSYLKREARRFLGIKMENNEFNHKITVSMRNIKEILNQPHKHFNEKK